MQSFWRLCLFFSAVGHRRQTVLRVVGLGMTFPLLLVMALVQHRDVGLALVLIARQMHHFLAAAAVRGWVVCSGTMGGLTGWCRSKFDLVLPIQLRLTDLYFYGLPRLSARCSLLGELGCYNWLLVTFVTAWLHLAYTFYCSGLRCMIAGIIFFRLSP